MKEKHCLLSKIIIESQCMLEVIIKDIKTLLRDVGVTGDLEFTTPPNPELGDIALPCFTMAKESKKSPVELAREISEKLKVKACSPMSGGESLKFIEKIEALGPYVNFYLDTAELSKTVIKEIEKKEKDYGANKNGKGAKVMVEYSQPNTHKEFHIGHLRNVCIGSSVVEILKNNGYKVVAANYIGDIGAHVAKCLWYIKKFGKEASDDVSPGQWLGKMYAEASAYIENNPEAKIEVAEVQNKLESGDKEWLKFWKETKEWSMDSFKKIYSTGLKNNDFSVCRQNIKGDQAGN